MNGLSFSEATILDEGGLDDLMWTCIDCALAAGYDMEGSEQCQNAELGCPGCPWLEV